jgi:hypothetical protein
MNKEEEKKQESVSVTIVLPPLSIKATDSSKKGSK